MAKVKINWPPMSMKAEGEDAAVLAQAEQFLKYVKEAHKISFDVLPTIFRDAAVTRKRALESRNVWDAMTTARVAKPTRKQIR